MRCEAEAKSTGERCKRSAKAGFNVCRVHGANRGTPGNSHAVKHGAYETLMRKRLPENQRAEFDAVSVDATLAAELRIIRFKLLRLIGDVEQNIHGKDSTWKVKADAFEKGRAIAYLAGEARKIVKEMQGDPLSKEMEGFLAGVNTIREMQAEDLSEG